MFARFTSLNKLDPTDKKEEILDEIEATFSDEEEPEDESKSSEEEEDDV